MNDSGKQFFDGGRVRLHLGIEAACERFEAAWRTALDETAAPPHLEDYCSLPAGEDDSGVVGRLLQELIMLDLEYRWQRRAAAKAPRPATAAESVTETVAAGGFEGPLLEEYFSRFPAAAIGGAPLDMIAHEYHVRSVYGDLPSHEEYRRRFPAREESLERALAEIDAARPSTDRDGQSPGEGAVMTPPLRRKGDAAIASLQETCNERLPVADDDTLSLGEIKLLDQWCSRFEKAWQDGEEPRIESYLGEAPPPLKPPLLRQLLKLDWSYRRRSGKTVQWSDYADRFPDVPEPVRDSVSISEPEGAPPTIAYHGHSSPEAAHADAAEKLPRRIGRYELRKELGRGAFGIVYLGHDTELDRPVAVKFLTARCFHSQEAVEKLRTEARNLARLKHPAIVAIHDVHIEPGKAGYLVMEYVPGRSLKEALLEGRLPLRHAVRGLTEAAEALYHAHQHGLVHRDLKPANLLLDRDGGFHVVDFGLAVREDTQQWLQGEIGGTPAYMAPEQVRGETHRLDGRTDVWGLGVVFYEMLTLQRPFSGSSAKELFQSILADDPKPPRHLDDTIDRELDRVCMKCLGKWMSERYACAQDLANDLRLWLAEQTDGGGLSISTSRVVPAASSEATASMSGYWAAPAKVIPRGLRSFSFQDKDFFLELVPGPRDREGLPESLHHWKSRIENLNEGDPCCLLYGPSGCGKSSWVKAGLLPRLAGHVIPVFLEAVPEGTEQRLLHDLRQTCRQLDDDLSLPQAFAALRGGRIAWPDRKILIVIDQFEQWLHTHPADERHDLIDALRQCDGKRLQALIMVRDDFWLATARFLKALETPLMEGKNAFMIDLFDARHARRVLARFGQAYGALPENPRDFSSAEQRFLDRAVRELLDDGKIIPVRLSLFAEMVKDKPWTPQTLDDVGGLEGLGIAFLEESFGVTAASPQHRFHRQAAQAVLHKLLPDHGADIRGYIHSESELRDASGYAESPENFRELMGILDGELRLITPTDPEGQAAKPSAGATAASGERFYQLSHDYLVRSLRDWLSAKQRETWQGRAKLRLEERTNQWKSTRQKRFLPSALEYVVIRAGVPRRQWNAQERALLAAAGRRHGTRLLVLLCILVLALWGFHEANGRIQGRQVSERVLGAKAPDLDALIHQELPPYRSWTEDRFRTVLADSQADGDWRIRAALALGAEDPHAEDYLESRLSDCPLDVFSVICESLGPVQDTVAPRLRKTFHNLQAGDSERFRAGLALVQWASGEPKLSSEHAAFLARQLVLAPPDDQLMLRRLLKPRASVIMDPLTSLYHEETLRETARRAAAGAFKDFASENIPLLATLAAEGTAEQFNELYPVLARRSAAAQSAFQKIIAAPPRKVSISPQDAPFADAEHLRAGRRRAGAAIGLLRLGRGELLREFFVFREDPEPVTQFIHGLKDRGVSARQVAAFYESAATAPERSAAISALGNYPPGEFDQVMLDQILTALRRQRRDDPDSAVHSLSGWLLAKWHDKDPGPQPGKESSPPGPSAEKTWFTQRIAGEELHFIVFAPGKFQMGSPEKEPGHQQDEEIEPSNIPRPFAVCDREVSRRLFEKFQRESGNPLYPLEKIAPDSESAMVGVSWTLAIEFCQWLTLKSGMTEKDLCYNPIKDWIHKEHFKGIVYTQGKAGFRLPTESEWEYACRSGTMTPYGFGADRTLLPYYAWTVENSGSVSHPSGLLLPNPRGLFDMHGNAYEWCHNYYVRKLTFSGSMSNEERKSFSRVLRGGSRTENAEKTRSAYRHSEDQPRLGKINYGFRVVRTLPSPSPPKAADARKTQKDLPPSTPAQ
jgi:eukaryotic-like serine/threonine-protein kinase